MDENQKKICKQIAKMDSQEAAEWLINTYPTCSSNYSEAFLLIPHRSWRRTDQKRLANYYLNKLPFSGELGYKSLAAAMPIKTLISCITKRLPMSKNDTELLLYYLIPTLKKISRSPIDSQIISDFVIQTQKYS